MTGLGDRPASISRELTKKFEETKRGPLSSLLAWVEERTPRGEFVLVVGGAPKDGGNGEEAEEPPGRDEWEGAE
jgi:16S rRNA (cytidine1402-2'-O)-methyltransferase